PEFGKRGEYGVDSPQKHGVLPGPVVSQTPRVGLHDASGSCTEQPSYVFDDDKLRAQNVDGVGHVGPEAGAGAVGHSGTATGDGHVLAGEPAGEYVDRLDGGPINGGDIVQVRDVGPVVGEDLGWGGVELAEPCVFGVVDGLDGEVESSVPGEQGPDLESHLGPFRA